MFILEVLINLLCSRFHNQHYKIVYFPFIIIITIKFLAASNLSRPRRTEADVFEMLHNTKRIYLFSIYNHTKNTTVVSWNFNRKIRF